MTPASCLISGSRGITGAAESKSEDTCVCAQVQAALEDARSGTSQVQVMQAAQASIDAKRQVEPKS